MSFVVKTTTNIEKVAGFVASANLKQLKLGKEVLFLATGGFSIPVCVKISEILRNQSSGDLIKNLIFEERVSFAKKNSPCLAKSLCKDNN